MPSAPVAPGSTADEFVATWLRSTYNLGREGVSRASCDVHVVWDRRYFREPIEWDGRFEFGDGRAEFRWKDRGGDVDVEAELGRLFDPNWLRRDLSSPVVATREGPPGAVVVRVGSANSLRATSLTFGTDGRLDAAVVRVVCGDGVEREGPRTYTYESRDGRHLLVRHSIAFPDEQCSDETTITWVEHQRLAVPAAILRHRSAGKEYESVTFRLSGWTLELAPGK